MKSGLSRAAGAQFRPLVIRNRWTGFLPAQEHDVILEIAA